MMVDPEDATAILAGSIAANRKSPSRVRASNHLRSQVRSAQVRVMKLDKSGSHPGLSQEGNSFRT